MPSENLPPRCPEAASSEQGKAFLPFIKSALYKELQTAALNAGVEAPAQNSRARSLVEGHPEGWKQPSNFDEIGVGSIVLAASTPRSLDWYEVVVIAVEGDELRLAYCDFPHEPPIVRRRSELGLLHPTYLPEPPLQAE